MFRCYKLLVSRKNKEMYDLYSTPHMIGSYWRPWHEDSNIIDSYLDYLKDKSLVNYGINAIRASAQSSSATISASIETASMKQSDAIMQSAQMQQKAIMQASERQVNTINRVAREIGFKMDNVQEELSFLNRRQDFIIEQIQMQNFLLQNAIELLKIPDIEKERQYYISLGLKYEINAAKDSSLFDDALEAYQKAESMMKQDYFVLHRIGMIYLYSHKHLEPVLAQEYFLKAAKYSLIESSPEAARLAYFLVNNINSEYASAHNDEQKITLIAADSYEKAAFAAYILGNDDDAIEYEQNAYNINKNPRSQFLLVKYLARKGQIEIAKTNLDNAIENCPFLSKAVFADYDVMQVSELIEVVKTKNDAVNATIKDIINGMPTGDFADIAFQILHNSDYTEKRKFIKSLIS